jgi:hypothetical protein
VTVIADAGMMSEANLAEVEDAGWSFVIGGKLPEVPYVISQWRQANPDAEPADGMTLIQPVIMGPKADQRRRPTIYQYKTTGPGAPCTASTSRLPRAKGRRRGRRRSNGPARHPNDGIRAVNRDLETKARRSCNACEGRSPRNRQWLGCSIPR